MISSSSTAGPQTGDRMVDSSGRVVSAMGVLSEFLGCHRGTRLPSLPVSLEKKTLGSKLEKDVSEHRQEVLASWMHGITSSAGMRRRRISALRQSTTTAG